jgi:dCTP diphosphatase
MTDITTTVQALRDMVAAFVDKRQWQPFHAPKNLAMSLAVEAAELMEHFLWMENAASRGIAHDAVKLQQVGEEIADILCNVLCLCNALQLDLSTAFVAKMKKNVVKYPADKYRGRYQL